MDKKIMFSFLGVLVIGSVAYADFSLSQWQYKKEILDVKKGLNKVSLDNEVFANSNEGLADMRIVDDSNREIPYKLIATRNEEGRKEYSPRLINNSVADGKYSMVIMDLGERGIITNSLKIGTSSDNFQRNVTVHGSEDQENWNVLNSEGYIYDYTDKKAGIKSQDTRVSFPDTTFRFLKVEISNVENNPVMINSVSVSQYIRKGAKEFSISPKIESSPDDRNKATVLIADLGQGGIPTGRISIATVDENFNRGVVVYSSNDRGVENWKRVGYGNLFRYKTPGFSGENLAMDIDETTDRYIKMVIYNKDNAPLGIREVKMLATYRELVFQADSNEKYFLFYGNRKADTPEYDLEKYFQYLDLTGSWEVSLGAQQDNRGFIEEKREEKPLTERNPYFFTVVLVATGLLLLLVVYKFLKK
ncbi:MAG: hypothetical protein UW95_C0015G0006 [Parcubacteria group bacterium GW2011_GWC1_45_14]|nr:MAG: hypothetical protein UW95_C0015G0006 [Parcubacteria group bacterium GW2011_GWC1_45_14]